MDTSFFQISTHIESHELIEGFWKDPGALYHASMVLLSILGLKWPALYAIHLLDFLFRDEVLQGVISSITLNWNSLSKTVSSEHFFEAQIINFFLNL